MFSNSSHIFKSSWSLSTWICLRCCFNFVPWKISKKKRPYGGEYVFFPNHRTSKSKSMFGDVHPWNLTWNLKSTQLKRKIIFQTSIFRFHVKFQGSTHQFVQIRMQSMGVSEASREVTQEDLAERAVYLGTWKMFTSLKSSMDIQTDGLEKVAPFKCGYFRYLL